MNKLILIWGGNYVASKLPPYSSPIIEFESFVCEEGVMTSDLKEDIWGFDDDGE